MFSPMSYLPAFPSPLPCARSGSGHALTPSVASPSPLPATSSPSPHLAPTPPDLYVARSRAHSTSPCATAAARSSCRSSTRRSRLAVLYIVGSSPSSSTPLPRTLRRPRELPPPPLFLARTRSRHGSSPRLRCCRHGLAAPALPDLALLAPASTNRCRRCLVSQPSLQPTRLETEHGTVLLASSGAR